MATGRLHINRDIILAAKKQHMAKRQNVAPTEAVLALAQMQRRPRGILNYTSDGGKIRLIAQITRNDIYDPVSVALRCVAEGADAIAFFTDNSIYHDDLDDLLMIARALRNVPVIYQNYVMNEYSVMAVRASDASAIVLYGSLLEAAELRNVVSMTMRWKMSALIQVNAVDEFETAYNLSPHAICFGDHLSGNIANAIDLIKQTSHDNLYHVRRVLMNTLQHMDDVELAVTTPVDAIIVSEDLFKTEKSAHTLRRIIENAEAERV